MIKQKRKSSDILSEWTEQKLALTTMTLTIKTPSTVGNTLEKSKNRTEFRKKLTKIKSMNYRSNKKRLS